MYRSSTRIEELRADRGADSVMLVDYGYTIQGNPLAYYCAKRELIIATGETHPLAKTCNHLGNDAQVVGNLEFNYGLDLLATYQDQVDFDDPVETAQKYVPEMKEAGTDVVVLSHSGKEPTGQTWDPSKLQENVSSSVAEVSGVDLLVAGQLNPKSPRGRLRAKLPRIPRSMILSPPSTRRPSTV